MGGPIVHRAKVEGEDGTTVLDDSPGVIFPWWSFTKTAFAEETDEGVNERAVIELAMQ